MIPLCTWSNELPARFVFVAHSALVLIFASPASLSYWSDRLSWWKLAHFIPTPKSSLVSNACQSSALCSALLFRSVYYSTLFCCDVFQLLLGAVYIQSSVYRPNPEYHAISVNCSDESNILRNGSASLICDVERAPALSSSQPTARLLTSHI